MKTKTDSKKGSVAIALLMLAMIVPAMVGSYALVSANNQRATQHAIQRMEAKMIAENAVSMGAEAFFYGLKQDPTIGHEAMGKKLKGKRKRFRKRALVSAKKDEGYRIQALDITCSRIARTNLVNIVAAVENSRTGVRIGLFASYKVVEVSFLDYAIFSDGIFELAPWPRMDVYGDVRVNDLVRIGARYGLYFHDNLWTTEQIAVQPAWGKSASDNAQKIFAEASDGTDKSFYYNGNVLDKTDSNWEADSRARWGEDTIKANVPALQVPISPANNHLLIEPRDVVNDSPVLQREKMAWKASRSHGVLIRVDHNGNVTYEENGDGNVKSALPKKDIAEPQSKDTSDGVYTLEKYKIHGKWVRGWIDVDNTFEDGRETSKGVRVVNIYMDQLLKKFKNATTVYVEVEDGNGNLTPFMEAKQSDPTLKLPAVRIRNGNDISAAGYGFTIATHRMAYIEGNFNKDHKISALVAADNVTVLSNGWNDSNKGIKRPNSALDTYYQAAFMVGGYTYKPNSPSGNIEGFQNLVRYRENWGGLHKTYYYDGSYVKLFNSQETTGAAQSAWFRAPDRVITYNSDFVANPPPGMPTALAAPEIVQWREITWDEAQAMIQ